MNSLSHSRPKRVKLDVVQKSRLLDLPGCELYPTYRLLDNADLSKTSEQDLLILR
jgi:hypothetical protein